MKDDNIFNRIIENYGRLTRSELKIADYLLTHKTSSPYSTISELAAAAGVSDATVTRFCRSAAGMNFNDFRRALAEASLAGQTAKTETPDLYEQVLSSDSIEVKSRKLCHIASHALQKTMDLLDPDAIRRAVDLLCSARQVFCLGQGNSSIMAYDTCGRFCSVSTKFNWISDSHLQASYAAIAGEGDVFLYFSFSAATQELMEVGRLLKHTPAKLILITRFPSMPAAQNADICLVCGADESPHHQGSIAAKIGQLYLIDVLFYEYCARDAKTSQVLRNKALAATSRKLVMQ